MAHSISLGRFSKEDGENIRRELEHRTYMDFRVLVCAAGGEFEVWIESAKAETLDELRNMLLFYMAAIIADWNRVPWNYGT